MHSGGSMRAKARMLRRDGRLRGHRAVRILRRLARRWTNVHLPVLVWDRRGRFWIEGVSPSGRAFTVVVE